MRRAKRTPAARKLTPRPKSGALIWERLGGGEASRKLDYAAIIRAATKLADEAGVNMVTLAVAWVLANPAITAPIIGASNPHQLDPSLAAATYALDPDLKARLDDLTREYRLGDAPR